MDLDDLTFDAGVLLDLRPDGWTKTPLHDMAKLAEEVGEVAECMVKSIKTKEDLSEELSDVLIVVAVIALRAGIDLNKACPAKQVARIQKLLDRFHNGKMPDSIKLSMADRLKLAGN
jgi:NTP pyrophosphatase (non-canonical NTP hydrolase)